MTNSEAKATKKQYEVFSGGTFNDPLPFSSIGWFNASSVEDATKQAKRLLRHDCNKRFIISCLDEDIKITNDL